MEIRQAEYKDIPQLIKMRWDFTLEDYPDKGIREEEYENFEAECSSFLETALANGKWTVWVAEVNGEIVSHIYIEQIEKVPRPGRVTQPFAYMTNVYTCPEYRGQGIGGKLLAAVNTWAAAEQYEFMIVWPSEAGVRHYEKHGYARCSDPMEYVPNGKN